MSLLPTPQTLRSGEWMTPRQVSAVTHYALQTLANYRSTGVGLPYIKLPTGRIRYRRADVEALISAAAAA
ncbi:helix-turn-helix transcriptional regulator [Streptomyces sp. NPDC090112]|uniref:helix-turn-helix transcriptional regulator n=1 Tax=Streptomyces sp. NPDC090112 TaxID=3365949 RepID=UPI0038234D94